MSSKDTYYGIRNALFEKLSRYESSLNTWHNRLLLKFEGTQHIALYVEISPPKSQPSYTCLSAVFAIHGQTDYFPIDLFHGVIYFENEGLDRFQSFVEHARTNAYKFGIDKDGKFYFIRAHVDTPETVREIAKSIVSLVELVEFHVGELPKGKMSSSTFQELYT